MEEFAKALEALLVGPDNEEIQTIYIRLKNGKTLVFLGAPVSEEDFDQIDDIRIGECVPVELIGAGRGQSMRPQ